jgi:VWFA-related protein
MTRHTALTAAIALATATLLAGQDQTPQRTFRTGANVVRVDVSARDGRRAVTGLAASDFVITDNGVPQQITEVSYGRLPIDVTVALDISGSVTGRMLLELRSAVLDLMKDLGDDDRLKLIGFNMRVSRVVDFTTDTAAIEQAIQNATAGGGTAMRDAASVALISATEPDRRQLVVLFTDGADSSSVTTEDGLVAVAQRTNASLTIVVPERLTAFGTQARTRRYVRWLRELTNETGGTVVTAGGDLTSTFRRALDEFRSSYVLYFTPTGVDTEGFHALEVRVPRDDGYTIRARRGYFGG